MPNWEALATRQYSDLLEYAARRQSELVPMLRPYLDVTDAYGVLLCEIVLILGESAPGTAIEAARRDLLCDVFDFLYESRSHIVKGTIEIAHPLARRAYESLSLLVASDLDESVGQRWMDQRKLDNSEIRRVLGSHPNGESEVKLRELYNFFCKASHPNRAMVAHRLLGEGNQFTLGAVGRPSLAILADYAIKTLDLWFWFGAFASSKYLPLLEKADPDFSGSYLRVSQNAPSVRMWLTQQMNRMIAEETEIMKLTAAHRPTLDT